MNRRARFDDVAAAVAFELHGFESEIVAETAHEVGPALVAAADAARSGAWVAGFVSYEAAPALDPALRVRSPRGGLPLAWFGVFRRRVDDAVLQPRQERPAPYSVSTWVPDVERAEYEASIATIRDHIAAGDTYQVNHTFRLRASFAGSAFDLYRDMALAQGGAFCAFLDTGTHQVASASPELFFRVDGRSIETRPMKGTRRRGRWPEEDRRLAADLLESEKDVAENLIIVDLLRNDLGRVARFGTVDVDRLCDLERYETVWQLTSTVSAELRPEVEVPDVFSALFPCGSVTGAPKARTMEIIAGLESSPRGVYCGAVGYLAPPDTPGPDALFSVAIRTVVVDGGEGVAEYGVGGGITWDSSPAGEFEETREKARVLVDRRPEFSLLETLRYHPGDGFSWRRRHLDRMEDSALYFGFQFDRSRVVAAMDEAVAAFEDGVYLVRVLVSRSGGIEVTARTLGNGSVGPLRLAIDPEPVSSQNVFLFHKTTHRREYEGRRARHPDADDVLLVNERGEVTESSVANVLVRMDGRWWTPPLESGCLPGVYRAVLLDEGSVSERAISVDDLGDADEIALVNSVRLRMPAVLVSGSGVAPVIPMRRAE